jgi:predicted aminopeptidase
MKTFFKTIKRLGLLLIGLILLWSIFNFSLINYGIDQLRGQLHIVRSARPIEEMLRDSTVSDSIKQRLIFVNKIKQFAIDSLGLKASENYTTFYDQHGKPLLWVITASDPFQLKPYHWKFPLLGSVSYKGFFKYENGLDELNQLKEDGYDTEYNTVSAWSTLGWFTDPILSNMIHRSKGRIAELIIHEMTHATLYLKSNVNFNENLASVCGEEGAIQFLKSTYGDTSAELREYIFAKEDYDSFSKHMISGSEKLDSLYDSVKDSIVLYKKKVKAEMISSIVNALDTVNFHSKKKYSELFADEKPNNTYFLDFIRYDAQKDEMKKELNKRFNGNIKKYLDELKAREQ